MLESVKQAKIGSIVPVYKELDEEIDAFEYFAKLSNYGRKKNSLLIEYNGKSIGTANPGVVLTGKGDNFEIKAINEQGKRFLTFIKKDFGFCSKATYGKDRIYGMLTKAKRAVTEEQRLRLKTHMDIMRAVAFKFEPVLKPLEHYTGLFGIVSSDFIGSIEEIPDAEDNINDPDYVLYFLDNMFIVDHDSKKTYFIANALITDNKKDQAYGQCSRTIKGYEKLMGKKLPKKKKLKKKAFEASYKDKKDFINILKEAKKKIIGGDVLYASVPRTAVCSHNSEPLDVYAKLKLAGNSSFYINDEAGISIGTLEGTSLKVAGENEKAIELNLEAPSFSKDGNAQDKDLDNRHEMMLRSDEDYAVNHAILLDAARNDVARVSQIGTRHASRLFYINKRDHALSLSSSVEGILKKDLDALHAFAAIFGFGTGLPKIKAASLLSSIGKKGHCSGSLIHVAPDEDLESCSASILRIKKDKAHLKCLSHVFYNTDEEDEAGKNENKLLAKLDAIRSVGEFK